MATKVQTISICDQCGITHTRDAAEGSLPPVDWSAMDIITRFAGPGWANNKRTEKQICPECTSNLLKYLGD